MKHFDIIIVGGGPAGLTAAIYARRAGKSVLLLEKESFGGQIASSPKVENFPGFAAISGAELADRLYSQADELGVRLELEEVLEIRDGAVKTVVTDYGAYDCKALILATGMKHRTLGLPGEDAMGGISFCAVCDGSFYKGRDTAVCGGGNTALQDALFLSDICRKVTVIHRRDEFRGDPILVEQLKKRANVAFAMNTVVTGLLGNGALSGLALKNTVTGEESQLAVDGLFEAVGQLPEKKLASSVAEVDEAGFVPAGEDRLTSAAGIFVAGDCRAKEVRQLTTACADGAVAALAACKYCDAQ
jgi:thioredoxin reductase (NADPH)